MKRVFVMFMAVAGLALAAAPAQAHTEAFGFIPQPNGDVDFYIGSYTHGGVIPLQGSLDITSGPVTGSFAFTSLFLSTTPAALGLIAPGATYAEDLALGPIVHFQKVTVSGLVSGVYTFDISGVPSAFWLKSGSLFPWTRTATVSVLSDVPEPTSMALFGLTALGMVFAARRRRRRKGDAAQAPAVS